MPTLDPHGKCSPVGIRMPSLATTVLVTPRVTKPHRRRLSVNTLSILGRRAKAARLHRPVLVGSALAAAAASALSSSWMESGVGEWAISTRALVMVKAEDWMAAHVMTAKRLAMTSLGAHGSSP